MTLKIKLKNIWKKKTIVQAKKKNLLFMSRKFWITVAEIDKKRPTGLGPNKEY